MHKKVTTLRTFFDALFHESNIGKKHRTINKYKPVGSSAGGQWWQQWQWCESQERQEMRKIKKSAVAVAAVMGAVA